MFVKNVREAIARQLNASFPLWGLTLALLFGTVVLLPSFFRLVTFLAWFLLLSWMLGGLARRDSDTMRIIFGVLGAGSFFGLAFTCLALVGSVTVVSVTLIIVAMTILGIAFFDRAFPTRHSLVTTSFDIPSLAYLLIVVFGDVWLLVTFFNSWTTEPLVSPWQLFSLPVFLIYAVSTFALILFSRMRDGSASLILSVVHFFVSLSVAVMVYGIGFGFDPFIHRAAEMTMVHYGFIEPRRILYLGQYALIAGVNLVTGFPVMLLDKWLVPMLASVSLPLVGYVGLRRGWQLSALTSRTFLHLIFLFPYMFLVFTVPFNLGLLLLLLTLFLSPLAHTWRDRVVFLLLGFFSLSVHPLAGVPLLLFIVVQTLCAVRSRRLRLLALGVGFIGSAVAMPLLFATYNIGAGSPPFFFHSYPFARFLSLFLDPYPAGIAPIPLALEWFYDVMRWLPRVLCAVGLVAAWRWRRTLPVSVLPTLVVVFGLLVSLFFVTSSFSFKDVIEYEQLEFAIRLLQTIFLFTIPWAIFFIARVLRRFTQKTFFHDVCLGIGLALFLTATWYLSYPQLNLKVRDGGSSVSAADVEVARFLESRYVGEPYIVLSHQMTSAAAVQEMGFRHYVNTKDGLALWYAIPTGGALYRYFLQLSTYGPTPQSIQEVREYTGVEHIYFVTYDSWPRAGFVRSRAAEFADASYGIEGTKLVIYEYK